MKKIIIMQILCTTIVMAGRYYDADVGFFVSVDPVGEFWNAYSYVGGNPINVIDPTGLYTEIIVDANNNVIDQWFIDDGDHTTNTYQASGNDMNLISSSGELLIDNYLYSNTNGNWSMNNILGNTWVGTDWSSHLQWSWQFAKDVGGASPYGSGAFQDFKTKHVGEIGIVGGYVISPRDAGNVLWGKYMNNIRHVPLWTTKIATDIYAGKKAYFTQGKGEDAKSWNMQKWGHQNANKIKF